MAFIIDDLFAALQTYLLVMELIYIIAIAGLSYLFVRKLMKKVNDKFATEVGVLAALFIAIFSWYYLFASLALTGIAIVMFYIFGPTLIGVAAFLAILLKD